MKIKCLLCLDTRVYRSWDVFVTTGYDAGVGASNTKWQHGRQDQVLVLTFLDLITAQVC
jgi:hypothetical protein